MGRIGFYINHGVEVRYFLLSGIIDEYQKSNQVCLYVHDNHSDTLKNYASKYNVEIKVLPVKEINPPNFEKYQRAFTNARKRANDVEIYNHFGNISKPRFYDFLFKLSIIIRLGNLYFRHKAKTHYKNEILIDYFKSENLQKMYLLQYDSILLKLIGINAALSGAEIMVFMNTLKTLFIDDFVSIPITKLFSWNQTQNVLFQKANLGINSRKFEAKGSPYHNFLRIEDDNYRQKVVKKYGLNIKKPIIVYSLINEKVYDKEHLIIEMISTYFNENFEEERRPQLVIRRNPFEQDGTHIAKMKALKDVVIADHFWERKEEKSWSIQELEGELEWRAMLQLANLNINIPSMATIDAIMCGTPVLNIGFGESGGYLKHLEYIIESSFSLSFEKCQFVRTARKYSNFKFDFMDMLQIDSCKKFIIDSLDIEKSVTVEFL